MQHSKILENGVDAWNHWRMQHPRIKPDLFGANFSGANLIGVNLSESNIQEGNFEGANLAQSHFHGSDLIGINLRRTNLWSSDFSRAKLRVADLRESNLREAWFDEADLTAANLSGAILIETSFEKATLEGCHVYGCSSWNVNLSGANQDNLVIWRGNLEYDEEGIVNPYELKDEFPLEYVQMVAEPSITVDNLEVAQFIYLLLHNEKIRDVIDTIGKKGVLLLGRFTEGRIAILGRLRTELRKRDFLPIVFNFDKPDTKNFSETVRLLASMSHFVIADITNPKSTPLELQAVVPECMIPFATIIEEGEKPFAMFKDLWITYQKWVFPPIAYSSLEELVSGLDEYIINPAQKRFKQLLVQKAREMPVRSMRDLIKGRRS